MSQPARPKEKDTAPALPKEAPRAPTEAAWAAMTEAERERAEEALLMSETEEELEEREAMAEGDPHLEAKIDIRDTLRRFFGGTGRSLYVGADIKIYYPGEKGFTPDVIAARDAEQRPRDCWMVSREGKGVDLALEVHYKGNWRKDFVDNVEKYARLGIAEYFIYDLRRQHVKGYRLAGAQARSYEELRSQKGRLRSGVLGLDLVVEDGRLRFYQGNALLLPLERLFENVQARADEEQARADEEQARAEHAIGRLREALLHVLAGRVDLSEAERQRVLGETDVDLLDRWLRRALSAQSAAELFQDG